MKSPAPESQLAGFVAKFSPETAALIKAVRAKMRQRLPHAIELVYDNYNFFVIGYGPTERPSEAVFSIAAQASGVALCFLHGAKLPDPDKILRGQGTRVRNIKLPTAAQLDEPVVQKLIAAAIENSPKPFDPSTPHRLIIRAVSAKQRPRRSAKRRAAA